ncbi:MAG: glycosyltransferase family 2 protein [Chloroflexota bacterium]|nr:MAG: glycosyltransferase family 2 protein [Chloroflexota bacterium]
MPGIAVALPAYNEELSLPRTVPRVVTELRKVADDFEVVVVDDGSSDRTSDVVRELSAQYPEVRLVQHPVNLGYGAAVWTGITSGQKEFVFFTDADGQFDIGELARFMPFTSEYDLIIGYRAPRRDPPMRLVNALGWKLFVTLLFGYVARDIDCAFKLFRRDVLDRVYVESRGAAFSAEFLVKAHDKGLRVKELPVSHLPREAGSATGNRPDVILRAFKEMTAFWFKSRVLRRDS